MGRILIWAVTLVGGVVLGIALARLLVPAQGQPAPQSAALAPAAPGETAASRPSDRGAETAPAAGLTPTRSGDTTGAPAPAGTSARSVSTTATPREEAIAPAVPSPSSPPPPTSTPPPAPTAPPAATSTPLPPSPTATATPEPAVTSTEAPAAAQSDSSSPEPSAILRQVARAEEVLQAGEFEATISYSGGSRSVGTILFHLGDEATEPRLHITTTYSGTEGVQVIERIVIGEQSWQRESNGAWTVQPTQESVWDQIQAYLPHAALVSNAERGEDEEGTFLEWYDEGRDTDVRLGVDVASGLPLALRQSARQGGATFTVIYRGWNVPITIQPPPAY